MKTEFLKYKIANLQGANKMLPDNRYKLYCSISLHFTVDDSVYKSTA